jgi:DNA-binding MarR family transcriptional regulator
MANAIYEKLREHLDSLPTGYPKTESGVELKILEKLFTEEEAEMTCQLKPVPESAEQIAQRLGRDPHAVADLLYRMSQKGLIFRIS